MPPYFAYQLFPFFAGVLLLVAVFRYRSRNKLPTVLFVGLFTFLIPTVLSLGLWIAGEDRLEPVIRLIDPQTDDSWVFLDGFYMLTMQLPYALSGIGFLLTVLGLFLHTRHLIRSRNHHPIER